MRPAGVRSLSMEYMSPVRKDNVSGAVRATLDSGRAVCFSGDHDCVWRVESREFSNRTTSTGAVHLTIDCLGVKEQ